MVRPELNSCNGNLLGRWETIGSFFHFNHTNIMLTDIEKILFYFVDRAAAWWRLPRANENPGQFTCPLGHHVGHGGHLLENGLVCPVCHPVNQEIVGSPD